MPQDQETIFFWPLEILDVAEVLFFDEVTSTGVKQGDPALLRTLFRNYVCSLDCVTWLY
jgi:hypothetical protein